MSEYICGRNSVIEALKSEREINKVLLADGVEARFRREIEDLCRDRGIPFQKTDKKVLEKLAGADNRGIVAQVAAATYVEVDDILEIANSRGEAPLIVILSQVEDPRNFGAIIRTAHSAGAHGIIIPKRRSAALTQTVFQAAQGAAEHLPVARVSNLVQTAQNLKNAGLWLVAGDMNGKYYWEVDFSGPLALVLGGEGQGIQPLLLKNCDYVATIPMLGKINSLNVSAAAAVLLYEAAKRRLS